MMFNVLGLPCPQGRARAFRAGGFVRVVDDPKSRREKGNFRAQAVAFRPGAPLEGALALTLTFRFPPPASWPAWRHEAALAGQVQHVSRPDVDNLAKLVMDALTGIFWRDDSQLVAVVAQKRYGPAPLTRVDIVVVPEVRSAREWRNAKAS